MRELKLSTSANVMIFMTDSADHVTGKTGLTLTITASKDGAAFASISPTVTERGNGWYSLALDATMTNTLGDLALHVTGTGADPSDVAMRVIAMDKAVANTPANVKAISDDEAAANALEALLDGSGAAVTMLSLNISNASGVGVVISGTTAGMSIAGTSTGAPALQLIPENMASAGVVVSGAVSAFTSASVGSVLALGTQAKADVNAEADAALADVGLTSTVTGRIDVAVSSRMATFSYTAPDNAGITAIKAKTDLLTFSGGKVAAQILLAGDFFQSFPANFALLAIDGSGRVTAIESGSAGPSQVGIKTQEVQLR